MDETTRKILDDLGFDLERDSVEATAKRLGLPLDRGFAASWQELASRVPDTDPWADGALLFDEPFKGPVPVELVGIFDLDPLEVTIELTRPAHLSEVSALNEWVATRARAEADDDDSVSSWSDVERGTLPGTGSPTLAWHYDAASAGPDTIRRLIEGIAQFAVEASIPAVRLYVGHTDQL